MNRALLASALALVSAVAAVGLLASPAQAHTPAFTTTCTTATLTATSYPAGSVLDITVDQVSIAHEVLAKPSYHDAPAVLTATFAGTGHTVTGTITSAGFTPFVQIEQTAVCSSASPSVTTSPSSSVSTSVSASSTPSVSPTPSSSASVSATRSASSRPSTSVEATVITKPPTKTGSTSSVTTGDELPKTGGSGRLLLAGLVVLTFGCALVGLANRRRRAS
jgi:uncharacterized surface anchored protein